MPLRYHNEWALARVENAGLHYHRKLILTPKEHMTLLPIQLDPL